jgi:hypothetical protein
MIMNKRTFSKEEKLQILREAADQWINPTFEKQGVPLGSFFPVPLRAKQAHFNGLDLKHFA